MIAIRNRLFALMLGSACAISVAFANPTQTAEAQTFSLLPAATLKAQLDQGKSPQVFDANSRETYAKGHVPGATWVEFDAVGGANLPADKNAELVFYCANEMCTASHIAARKAAALGYAHVAVMPEGIQGWRKAGYAVVSGESAN